MSANNSGLALSLTPLGAGDLIDRAVRFYRNNFWTFVFLASPPVIVGTLVSIAWTMLGRELFDFGSQGGGEDRVYSAIFTGLGNSVIWFFESVATLVVMGGASRNFVRHILFGEPITFRETYSNVRSRIGGLIGASIIIIFILSFLGTSIFYLGVTVAVIVILVIAALFQFSPALSVIVSCIVGILIAFGTGWLFFLSASRFAYVPQVMLVEGQGIISAIGRSLSLAKNNVKRLAALFIFTTFATYSALFLFYVPLGWYAYASGIEFSFFQADTLPAWYVVATQLVSQASLILLMPIWMIGLCLLYVDERVRHEGYDIELMAARNLGAIPALPQNYTNPLQPALSAQPYAELAPPNPGKQSSSISPLGLN